MTACALCGADLNTFPLATSDESVCIKTVECRMRREAQESSPAASRQRRYQVRHEALGLCALCPQPAAPGRLLCNVHLGRKRDWRRAQYRRMVLGG